MDSWYNRSSCVKSKVVVSFTINSGILIYNYTMYRSKNQLSEFDYPPSSEMDTLKTAGEPKNMTKIAKVLSKQRLIIN